MYSRMGHTGAGHEGAGQPAPSFDLSALSREELETLHDVPERPELRDKAHSPKQAQ